jgi:hypothetical protein
MLILPGIRLGRHLVQPRVCGFKSGIEDSFYDELQC